MTELDDLVGVLPRATMDAWPHVAAVAPSSGVLHGGTALAVHLRHRVSRDLDVFMFDDFDPETVAASLRERGNLAVDLMGEGTLNGVFDGAKVQFLSVRNQRQLEEPITVAGMSVASISDLYATKINAIAGRGELRDYFDLMRIEQDTGRPVEEGLRLFMDRFNVHRTNSTLAHAVGALGYLDDLEDDPYLASEFGNDIAGSTKAYWQKRQPQVVRSFDAAPVQQPQAPSLLSRLNTRRSRGKPKKSAESPEQDVKRAAQRVQGQPPPNRAPGGAGRGKVWVPPHTRNGRRVDGYWRDR